METEVKEINSIIFGILSADDMREMSAFEVKEAKISTNNLHDTVHDPRSGPIGSSLCETCNQTEWDCPGHFGHIELNAPILHPLFLSHIVNILNIFCYNCNEFILTKDHLELNNILKLEKEKRFNAVVDKIKKCDKCIHCSAFKAEYKIGASDITYKTIYRSFPKGKITDEKIEKEREREVMTAEMVKKLFENIKTEYVEMLEMSHPKDYCLTVFPVIPSCCRPYEIQDGNINDDDLTYQLMEIVKNNSMIGIISKQIEDLGRTDDKDNALDGAVKAEVEELKTKYVKYVNNLKFRIETYCNNSKGKATHATTGRAIKGLRERLTGKEGQIRTNLLGKRCEMSGRTVVGPDPTLRIDEMGLPRDMAVSLSVPVIVNKYNMEEVTKIVNAGQAIRIVKKKGGDGPNKDQEIKINLSAAMTCNGTMLQHDDVVMRKKDGEDEFYSIVIRDTKNFTLKAGDKLFRKDSEIFPIVLPTKRHITLEEGDIVHRHLKDGDVVFLNRQPTLHKGSMMAFKIKIRNSKTILINPACASPFNADFDGDEMNVHVPQSVEAQIELLTLSTPKQCLISSQAGKPSLTIVQDSLTGAYLMSLENNNTKSIEIHERNDILMVLSHPLGLKECPVNYFLKREEEISETLKKLGKFGLKDEDGKPFSGETLNGRGLLSLLLPRDLTVTNADLKITRGVIHFGFLSKKYLSSTETSLIKVLFKEYGVETCAAFIENVQFLTNKWLLISSFSIHAGDCIKHKEILGTIEECLMEAEKIKLTTKNPFVMENKITQALSNAKDIGMKIAKDALIKEGKNKNNFLTTVESGSKGDYFNLAQITGLLGQQNIQGQRIKPVLNNETRTLPHYPFPGTTDIPLIEEYESKGFISSSFAQGLTPREFIFHSSSGRVGVTDTALSTAQSGYNMRRIVKITEDIKIQYDGTVQDTHKRRFQMAYGGLGYDPSKTVKVNGKSQVCDVSRLVNRMNDNFERENE